MKPIGMIPCLWAALSSRLRARSPSAFVLEGHLAEAREGIAHVSRIVDRQTTSAARIDVCEGAVGKLRTLFRAKRRHAFMIAIDKPRLRRRGRGRGRGRVRVGPVECRALCENQPPLPDGRGRPSRPYE